MARIYPGAESYPTRGKPGGRFRGHHPPLLVLHTRESGTMGGHYPWPPHLTVDPLGRWQIRQHVPLNRSAYALHHSRPNHRANTYQIEIVGYARDVPHYPDSWYEGLAEVIARLHHLTGVPYTFPAPFTGSAAYGPNGKVRMSWREYDTATGIIGHQHVPTNSHWDPGSLDIHRLSTFLDSSHGYTAEVDKPPPARPAPFHHDLTAHPEGVATVNISLPILRHRKPNMHGQHVRILQALLTAFGQPVKMDGAFGPAVETAVKAFQSDHHIKPDGIVGQMTWRYLL